MARNIILLSDGTGNSASKLFKTNVWRLYQALDLTTPDPARPARPKQIAYYDDGVGTASFMPLAILGGVFGWGTKRIVLDLYTFLCRHYMEGDKVYAFGFSRGAFAVRMLTGLIANQGLVWAETESELRRLAAEAFRDYRENRYNRRNVVTLFFRYVRDALLGVWYWVRRQKRYDSGNNRPAPHIEFLGLWDTVAAYGLPFDELTHAWDLVFPLSFPDRGLSDIIDCAYHALALDDERLTFHPEVYSENPDDYTPDRYHKRPLGNRLTQVWFAGMHSNVGGGYPDDALAGVPLNWILDKAEERGLVFWQEERRRLGETACEYGKQYDSRQGLGGLYRYMPRNVEALTRGFIGQGRPPKIHESVFRRIENAVNGYAPIGLPKNYEVVMAKRPLAHGGVRLRRENPAEAEERWRRQEMIWSLVWWKRLVYFATVALFIALLLFPVKWPATPPGQGPLYDGLLYVVSAVIGFVGRFLPGLAGPWLKAFQSHPAPFLVIAALLGLALYLASRLQGRVFDNMREVWDILPAEVKPAAAPPPHGLIYGFRHKEQRRGAFKFMKERLISTALLIVIALFMVRSAFQLLDVSGFCRTAQAGSQTAGDFNTGDVGWAYSDKDSDDLIEGRHYKITLTPKAFWLDNHYIPAGPNGVERNSALMVLAIPFRRHLLEPYFKVVARIGRYGSDDYPLDWAAGPDGKTFTAEFTARKSGRLFLFVNDAVLPGPGSWQYFYGNNDGTAGVSVETWENNGEWRPLRP